MSDRDLDRLWAPAADDAPNSETASQIASRLSADLKPVRPLPSLWQLAAMFALAVVALAVLGAWVGGGHAIVRMNAATRILVFASLACSVALLAIALSGQMAPGSRQWARPAVLAIAILAVLGLLFAALFSLRNERHFWIHAWICLRAGTIAGALAGLPIWLLLRRGAVLDRRACGALAGLLGGISGTLMLEFDCANFNVAHVLVAHWGVALFCAGAGWLIGAIAEQRALVARA